MSETDDSVRLDWINEYAKRNLGVADDWHWFRWSRKGKDAHEYLEVSGAVCTAKYLKGKYKGDTNWELRDRTTEVTFAVRLVELETFQLQWEGETGKCYNCYGTGQAWTGWSSAEGNSFQPCRRCSATGKAPVASEKAA